MMMREEEQRYNRGLAHRKCQTFNKNKVAGRAPITNTLKHVRQILSKKAEYGWNRERKQRIRRDRQSQVHLPVY